MTKFLSVIMMIAISLCSHMAYAQNCSQQYKTASNTAVANASTSAAQWPSQVRNVTSKDLQLEASNNLNNKGMPMVDAMKSATNAFQPAANALSLLPAGVLSSLTSATGPFGSLLTSGLNALSSLATSPFNMSNITSGLATLLGGAGGGGSGGSGSCDPPSLAEADWRTTQ